MKRPTLYLIGDFATEEFGFAIDSLPPDVDVRYFVSAAVAIRSAIDSPTETFPQPHLIVVAQNHPGQVQAAQVEQLHAAFPLARMMLLLGSWCEGEMRTGKPIAGITRVFWHAFPNAINRLVAGLRQGTVHDWAFPRIAGEQERVLREMPFRSSAAPKTNGFVLIRAADLFTFESTVVALDAHGYNAAWLDPKSLARYRRCDGVIWDAPRLDSVEWHLLAATRHRLAASPLVLLTGFPRREDRSLAKSLGIDALIAKPFLVEDLAATTDRLMKQPARQSDNRPAIAG